MRLFLTWYDVMAASQILTLYILMLVGARLPDPDKDVTDMAYGYSLIFPRHRQQDLTIYYLIWGRRLLDLDDLVHLDAGCGKTSGSGPRRHRYGMWVLSDLPSSWRTRWYKFDLDLSFWQSSRSCCCWTSWSWGWSETARHLRSIVRVSLPTAPHCSGWRWALCT